MPGPIASFFADPRRLPQANPQAPIGIPGAQPPFALASQVQQNANPLAQPGAPKRAAAPRQQSSGGFY